MDMLKSLKQYQQNLIRCNVITILKIFVEVIFHSVDSIATIGNFISIA